MRMYKVIYERKNCIGAATCVAANDARWRLLDDGKAELKDSVKKDAHFELIIDETELEKMMDAARSCPVNVIHIEDVETGKRLV